MKLLWLLLVCVGTALSSGCATRQPVSADADATDSAITLIVSDLVGALVQVRELNPNTTTLQLSTPITEFGTRLREALEIAGYGLQEVSGDQGPNYVSYAVRNAQTDSGTVNDYLVQINDFEIRREYSRTETGIYPSSVMYISGSRNVDEIDLNDEIFAEQGGGEFFVSGVENLSSGEFSEDLREIVADENSVIASGRRTSQQKVIARSREFSSKMDEKYELKSLEGMRPLKRLVVLFPDNQSLFIGAGNKFAIATLLDDFQDNDVIEIRACDDIDGKNEMAERRARRIKEEFVSHGLSVSQIYRAPCTRSNYRHQSDDSPTPVAIFQYRKSA